MAKKKVAIICGGRSAEHEISILSGRNVINALDRNQYDPILICISKEGTWYEFPDTSALDKVTAIKEKSLPAGAQRVALISHHNRPLIFNIDSKKEELIDIAFPILHGTYGEDGTIQGLFKMANVAFVGCGTFSCAAGMDKEVMKRLLQVANINSAKYLLLTPFHHMNYDEVVEKLGSPFFIKPASLGSSVGVYKIKNEVDYTTKLPVAFSYDHKILAEEFIEGRELECSVIGLNHAPKASLPAEVIPQHEFYSYEAKYLDDKGAILKIPAELSSAEVKMIKEVACKTFAVMGCDGLSRVDFFLNKAGKLYVNEINTLPGFTNISMYPKMWEASGLGYTDLITQLIELGFEKYRMDNELKTDYR